MLKEGRNDISTLMVIWNTSVSCLWSLPVLKWQTDRWGWCWEFFIQIALHASITGDSVSALCSASSFSLKFYWRGRKCTFFVEITTQLFKCFCNLECITPMNRLGEGDIAGKKKKKKALWTPSSFLGLIIQDFFIIWTCNCDQRDYSPP